MAPESVYGARPITFAMLALAAMAVEIAAVDTRPTLESLGLASVWVGLAAVCAWFVPRPKDPHAQPPSYVLALIVALGAAPFVVEPLRRDWTGDGYPLELQMVFALRNASLGLAVAAGWQVCLRLAAFAAVFLVLFSAAMTDHVAVLILLGLFTVVGSFWLALVYWSRLKHVLAAPAEVVVTETRTRCDRFPWLALAGVVLVAASILGLFVFGPNRSVYALGEWLPTSGGTGKFDPFSRGGVNDGDNETSGKNPESTGMTQTNSFLDSPLPSLYDVAQDLYGPPQKLRDQEQTIALGMTDKTEERKAPPDNLRPNREFPTSRKSPRQANTPPGRSARALFEVEGPTPLHIRVLSFDRFDGRAWHEAPMNGRRIYVEKDSASNWMLLSERELPIFAGSETHAFKLAAPEGSFIPTPPHLTRFRVGRVDRTNFFAWAHDRVLRFADRKTPSGIVVETECRTVDRRRLASLDFDHHDPIGRFDYDAVPAGIDPALVALAHEWGVGCAPGWPRIAAIVERLRSDYVHDTAYSPPPDCADPLAHFLLEARRGPDYQFASAAAVLVRIAGYPTRLVSGFYAHPHHYDAETKHTPVVKEDLHFWAEVMLPNGDWLVLEPTPGYEVAPARLSLSERVLAAIEALAEWTWRNAVAVGLTLIALVVVWVRRRELLDWAAVLSWRCFPGRTWREQVLRAVRVLERRGRWVGAPRAQCRTVAAWLHSALSGPQTHIAEFERWIRMVDWAAYAPDTPAPWSGEEVLAACRTILDGCTLRRWRQVVSG